MRRESKREVGQRRRLLRRAEPASVQIVAMRDDQQRGASRNTRGCCINPRRPHWIRCKGGVENAEGRRSIAARSTPPSRSHRLAPPYSERSPGSRGLVCATASATTSSAAQPETREPYSTCGGVLDLPPTSISQTSSPRQADGATDATDQTESGTGPACSRVQQRGGRRPLDDQEWPPGNRDIVAV
jgi:hypothetical protein